MKNRWLSVWPGFQNMKISRRSARFQTCLVVWLCACACDTVFALNRDRTLRQLHHTAWTEREGAPNGIQALAQTEDGYLWLGTSNGLFQFDGVRFQRPILRSGELPSGSIFTLKAVPGGGLWIGWLFMGASFLHRGAVTNYGDREGLPAATVHDFALDTAGTLWAGTSGGVRRFEGNRWERLGADWGIPDAPVRALFVDSSGELAVLTIETVFLLPAGAKRFVATSGRAGLNFGFVRVPDGAIYFSEPRGIRAISALASYAFADRPWVARSDRPLGMRSDRDGSLWIASDGSKSVGLGSKGIQRIRFPERVSPNAQATIERFTKSDGLTDDVISDIFEDREGSIWVATVGGLDRFRENSILPLAPAIPFSVVPAVAASDHGAVWVGTGENMFLAAPDGSLGEGLLPQGTSTSCAYRDAEGVLWLGLANLDGTASLARLGADGYSTIPLPQEVGVGSEVQAISKDSDGVLWISVTRTGIFRKTRSGWEFASTLPQQGRSPAIVILDAPDGRRWFGYPRNFLAVIHGNDVREYSPRDGLDVGNVLALRVKGSHLWVGGDAGLAIFDTNRFRRIVATEPDVLTGIAGIAEASNGDLWLNASVGVVRLSASEIERAVSRSNYRVEPRVFDFRDGLSGGPPTVRPLPGAITASDGRIWFTRARGVFWVDPNTLVHNAQPPPVSIVSVSVDGRAFDLTGSDTLPSGVSNLEIHYTATSLVIPERVRFRYRLEGTDDRWQEAGSRRTAYYTNLRPGEYRFHVIASNNDGVWNEVGATQSFSIPPAFFQTAWFATCVVLLIATGVGGVYKWRVRVVSERTKGLLQQRLIERERIARELHDTLLQSITGLIYKFHAAAQRLSPSEPTRQQLEKALDGADALIKEGRERVRDLRISERATGDLVDALTEVAHRCGEDRPARFSAVVQGTPRALHPIVHDELYSICREALVNAYTHAKAGTIEAELTYGREELRARVHDDGVGIDAEVLKAGSRDDHWGLSGMRERAERIGATLEIWSRPGGGTDVELRLPASTAYISRERRLQWPRLPWRKSGTSLERGNRV